MQEMEARVVSLLIEHLVKNTSLTTVGNHRHVFTYAFDGIMLYKSAVDKFGGEGAVLTMLMQKTLELTGFDLKWEVKPMTHNPEFDLDELYQEMRGDEDELLAACVDSDRAAAEKLFKLYPHWKFYDGVLYVLNDTTGMWSSDKVIHDMMINRFSCALHTTCMVKGDRVRSETSYGNCARTRSQLYPDLKVLAYDPEWMRNAENSSLGKLLFLNGWYDALEGVFHSKEDGFNPDILFFNRIPHVFLPSDHDAEYTSNLAQRMFTTPLGEKVGNFFIELLARALMGDSMKHFIFAVGRGNTGKSMLADALGHALGDLSDTFNAECLTTGSRNADESVSMRFALDARYSRIMTSSEMRMKSEFDGNLIKKLSSGGLDSLKGRFMRENEVKFKPHFMTIVLANDVPPIAGCGEEVVNRLLTIEYTRQYVDQPACDDELLKDPHLIEEIATVRFRTALVNVLIDAYARMRANGGPMTTPDEVKQNTQAWFNDNSDPLKKLQDAFAFTDMATDFTPSKTIESYLLDSANGIGISVKKFGDLLRVHCKKEGMFNIVSKPKRVSGATVRGYVGIRDLRRMNLNPSDECVLVEAVESV